MRAYSSKKYTEPVVVGNSLILSSHDGTVEVRVYEPIKYITDENKSVVYRPKQARRVATAIVSK